MGKKTLVLGASNNPERYSFLVINRLVANNHIVRAIGLNEGEINGVKIFNVKKLYKNIDTVTLYLNKENQKDYYEYILALSPNRVIFNPGTENTELENILMKNNISFERSCTLTLLAIGQY
jgi:predicted CoA-binding protein